MRLGFKAVGVEVLNSIYYDIVFSIPKMFFFLNYSLYCTSTRALVAVSTPEHPPSVSFRQENKDNNQQRLFM